MNPDILGYTAYILIGLFYPIQLIGMVKGRNVNLGSWPLISLTLGLVALQASFFFVTVPAYVVFGNLVNTAFAVVNLFYVLSSKPKLNSGGSSKLAKYAESFLKLNISALKPTSSPVDYDTAWYGPPPLVRSDFQPCKECGALVFGDPQNAVTISVYDFAFAVAREGKNLPPYEELIRPVRYDFFCKRDRPAYDRKVYTPQFGGNFSVDFFKWMDIPDSDRVLVQVTKDGQQYD